MPPSKKRTLEVSESSDDERHLAKGARSNDGGRRGLVALSSVASPSSSSAPSALAVKGTSSRGLAARQKQYRNEMAKLNYQFYVFTKGQLENGTVPTDGSIYEGAVANYIRHADDLRRRFSRAYGDTVSFGSGDCGQLGCGEGVTEARKPRIMASMRGLRVDQVASGGLHTVALSESGEVYSWGCNDEGSLGWLVTEDKDDGALPSKVAGFYPSQYGPNGRTDDMLDGSGKLIPFESRTEAIITQIAVGETQSLALSTVGDVYMWGTYKDNEGRKFRNIPPKDDTRIETGNKDMAKLEEDDSVEYYTPPRGNQDWPMHLVEIPGKAKDISAGGAFNAALLEDNTIVTWGVGECGELARPVPKLSKKTHISVILDDYLKPLPPVWEQPTPKREVVAIACGGYHLLVLVRESGEMSVYSSGLNQYGQLGLGDTENREKLTKIEALEGMNITKIEAGLQFSCFVDGTGKELYTCGRGDYGQLGVTLEQPDAGWFLKVPSRVPLVYEPTHTVSNPKDYSIKEEDIVEEDQPEIDQISCGSTHVLLLTKGGDAYSWGYGTMGACGQGMAEEDVLRPRKLETKIKSAQGQQREVKMRYVSGGGQHSTAIVVTSSTGFVS